MKKKSRSNPEITASPITTSIKENSGKITVFSKPDTKEKVTTFSLSLLLCWIILVYSNTITNGFVFDDVVSIENNVLIRNFSNIGSLFSQEYFTLSGEASYRPLVTLTYMVDYFLWELNPAGYHLTNLILHILSVSFLYLLTVKLWGDIRFAFLAASVFALSPVNAEAVNAISFREELLITPLCFFSLILHRDIQDYGISEGRRKLFKYAAPLLYFLALLSKEMAITLPLIIFVIDNYKDKKIDLKNYIGYLLVTILYLCIRFLLFLNLEEPIVELKDAVTNITMVLPLISFYMRLFLFPVNLVADYAGILHLNPWYIIILLLAIYYFFKTTNAKIKISVAWLLISLTPVLNIIPLRHPIAERYFYFPAVGASILLAAFIDQITGNIKRHALICLILSFFALLTYERNRIWKNDFILWTDTIEKMPGSFGGHYNLGIQYSKKGLMDKAALEYKVALELNPNSAETHYALGNIYFKREQIDAAIEEYKNALKIMPDHKEAMHNLQLAYKKTGKSKDVTYILSGLNPADNPIYHYNLGLLYVSEDRLAEAIEEFKIAVTLKPRTLEYHNNLGIAYAKNGQAAKAIEQFEIAVGLQPTYAEAINNMGIVYSNQGRFEEALNQFQSAIRLNPMEAKYYNGLGMAYFQQNRTEEAIKQFQIAVKLDQGFTEGHFNLGMALLSKGLQNIAKKEFEITLKLNPNHLQARQAITTLTQAGL